MCECEHAHRCMQCVVQSYGRGLEQAVNVRGWSGKGFSPTIAAVSSCVWEAFDTETTDAGGGGLLGQVGGLKSRASYEM